MKDREYTAELSLRRAFFQKNFPPIPTVMRPGRPLKNSCPNCGYMVLSERDTFDVCGICLWEDDGTDDMNANDDSVPNHMTLREGRDLFFQAKAQLEVSVFAADDFRRDIQSTFRQLDGLINNDQTSALADIQQLQQRIVTMPMTHSKYTLDQLPL